MKKTVCLFVVFMLLFIVACNHKSVENTSSSDSQYKFYSEATWGETNTSFQDIKNVKLWKVSGNNEIILDDTLKTKKFELHGDSLELEYTATRVMDKDNTGKLFGKYDFGIDVYSTEISDNSYYVHFRHDNGRMCFYSRTVKNNYREEALSEQEMRDIAVSELDNRLDVGWNDVYTEYRYDEHRLNLNATFPEEFGVVFRRSIHGYSTEDYISVIMSPRGEILAFDARTYGVFDEIAQTITKERLDAAKAALNKELLSDTLVNAKIAGHIICVNAKGEVYLKAGFSYDLDNGERHQEIVCVNVI